MVEEQDNLIYDRVFTRTILDNNNNWDVSIVGKQTMSRRNFLDLSAAPLLVENHLSYCDIRVELCKPSKKMVIAYSSH
jgi:hypothetical protein